MSVIRLFYLTIAGTVFVVDSFVLLKKNFTKREKREEIKLYDEKQFGDDLIVLESPKTLVENKIETNLSMNLPGNETEISDNGTLQQKTQHSELSSDDVHERKNFANSKSSRWISTINLEVPIEEHLAETSRSHIIKPQENSWKNSHYQKWIEKFKQSDYDRNVRPYHGIKPVEVVVSLHVIRLHSISESTMDFGIDVYYRENWTDPRLAFNQSEYGVEYFNMPPSIVDLLIWHPDTYFSNAIRADTEVPGSVTHRSLLRLYPSGTVYYIRKISLTADCPMDISLYPFDKQGCKLVMCSYSYLKNDLFYSWRHGDPIDFQEGLRLPEFQLLSHKSLYIDEVYYIGTYSTLHLCLLFKRSAGFCIMQVFFPATAVVMSSWVSLWMEEETQFQDVLGVILAVIFLGYSYNSVMPRVSYVKLLDLFMGACFLFVFLSLSKLVILKYCRKHYLRKISNRHSSLNIVDQIVLTDPQSSQLPSDDDDDDDEYHHSNGNKEKVRQNSYDKTKQMLQRRYAVAKIEFENNQLKLKAEKRFLRYLRIFHIVTQLALPISFATFFVFILIVYPNWPRPEPC